MREIKLTNGSVYFVDAEAYNKAAKLYHGEFANLNKINEET